jgi:possible surface protein (fragment)
LRGRYDESKKNSIHYFDDIAIDASPEILSFGGYDTTSKPIKMSPNSTVEVVSASSSLIDNTNGYIGARTLDQYPVKMVKSWRIKAGTPAGELLNMNLRNIGETDSGKTISAHVKFVLDYATSDTPQVSNAEGSINVVKDGLLHMYWMPKSDNSADKQGGHYEIQFYDDDTGRPIKLANMLLSIDLDGETEKSTVSSESAKGIIPTLPSDVGTANETGTKYPTIESNTGTSVTYKGKTDFGIDDTKTTPYGEGLTLFAGNTLNVSFETNDSRWGGYSVINIPKLGKVDLTLPEEPTHPIPTPLVDEPKLPPVVTPPQVGDIANTITYNRVAVRQVNTRWIDINGKELKDMVTDKDTKEHGTIQDYAYVNSETDTNGNVTHIFRQYTTKWVDEDNKELKTPVTTDSVKEHGDIPEYAYVTTNTDEKGNVTHVFRQYTTEWIDEDGKELKDIVKGASPMPRGDEIKDYKFVESKTDEKGNVKHIFKQFITKWVNTELEDLDDAVKTSEFKDAKTFENYQFVETREVGNIRTHIYRRYNTFWVEEKTNKELKKENKLVKEPGDITSYVYVRTETKENGDLVHIYKKVEQKKNDVPTGVKSNIMLTGITLILSALGITILNKKKRGA